ncbi:hypothetical protein K2Z83_15090 [Oscillochloris sp. ZM17-4]|uniref:hypothetical protein n=1 Tax=Oscillochloris sp. ZM17-4 TaxID=2866714 RepID=UPI001C73DE0B|nr:hypothetical protein [Oscillochloris sp. ZM17-4]MBX0329002.1 hypothetical protein [Oscillochloris sp. ZM17-4]
MDQTIAPPQAYRLLQQRLDRNVTGAPDSPTLIRILRLLFSPAEADLARRIPTTFIALGKLAKRAGMAEERLAEMIPGMAERGLLFDIEHEGRRYVALAPVVIGFFEFTYMRARGGYPTEELAQLFDEYFFEREDFARAVFAGQTQIGRALVREEALPAGDHSEILDWERASHIGRQTAARPPGPAHRARALRLRRRSRKPGAVSASAVNRPSEAARTLGLSTGSRKNHRQRWLTALRTCGA